MDDFDKWHDEDVYLRASYESIPDDCSDKRAARLLCQVMRDISEDHYCAGWLIGLEYSLFAAVFEDASFGDDLTTKEMGDVFELSHRCNGWWIWYDSPDHDSGERFVRMSEWTELYKTHMNAAKR